jgi:proton glutamate symport protein
VFTFEIELMMKRIPLHWQIAVALVAGVLAGLVAGESVLHLQFLGDLFLKGLKMIIVPLIASSIICGMAGIGASGAMGRIGAKTFGYYLCTSFFAVVTGLFLANIVRPGDGVALGLQESPDERLASSLEKFGDSPFAAVQRLLLDLVPSNFFEAMAEGHMLQIIFFCLLVGIFIARADTPHRDRLVGFFEAVFAVVMRLTHFVLAFAPIGIFALVAKTVATTGMAAFQGLGLYALTVLGGLLIHACVTLPLLLYLVGRCSPKKHVQAMSPALLTAFSTSSSSATLPLTMNSLENRAGISNRITSFVAPLGATINMDGTALYECVAAMFIAQAYGIELTVLQQFIVVVTALLASIGAAGIPMAGLVMISVILTAVGLPLEGVGLILAVDRILDMCRTTVNVWSDSSGAAIIAHSEGEPPKYT